MAFFLRTERDVSIFPFMGVAFIVAKLCCLAATTDDSDKKLLEATVRNLFSTPAKALAFMEEAFGVGAGGLALGGRLKHYKHVRGQPISFDAEAFRTLINPEEQRAQWFSRLLCLREELVLLPGVTEVRGGLGRHEMTALATRLLADSLVRQAHRVGCIVHYHRDANNNVATAKIHFTWDFRLSEDVKLISLIRELRPLLLRQPPQSLTRQPPPPVSSLPGGEACGIGQNTPGVHGDGVDVALAWDGRPHGGDRGDGNGGGEVFAGDPEDARTGAANDMVVVKAAGASTPSSAGRHSVASTIGTKRKSTDGALGRPHQARSLSKGNDKRGAAVKQARTKAPAPPSCACSADRLVKAGPSWIVAEVRVRGSSNLSGMAVGLQLPWALDSMDTGRLAINFTLSAVASASERRGRRQYELRVLETNKRSVVDPSGPTSVTQTSSLSVNVRSVDLAATLQDLCHDVVDEAVSAAPSAADLGACGTVSGDQEAPTAPTSSGGGEGPLAAGTVMPPSADTAAGRELGNIGGAIRLNVVDAPAAAPLSLSITMLSPVALDSKRHRATRTPGRLVIFFPVDNTQSDAVGVC